MNSKLIKNIIVLSIIISLSLSSKISFAEFVYNNETKDKLYLALGCTKLPEQEKREIVGIWRDVSGVTTSIEKWNNKIFEVLRYKDRSGGDIGKELILKSGYFVLVDNDFGEKYKILKNGKLGLYNREGLIATLEKCNKLWP